MEWRMEKGSLAFIVSVRVISWKRSREKPSPWLCLCRNSLPSWAGSTTPGTFQGRCDPSAFVEISEFPVLGQNT